MQVTELTDEEMDAFVTAAKESWPALVEQVGADYMNEFLAAAGISMN